MSAATRTIHVLSLSALLCLAGATAAPAGGAECARDADKTAHERHADVYTVEGDVHKPVRTGGPVPTYPDVGKEERIEGKVVAKVLIEKDGTVSEAEVVESLRDDFDAHALAALRQWTFEPATLDGEPVRVFYHLTVNYRLDGDGEKPAETRG